MPEKNQPHALACVIIPTYNEAENIGPLIEAIRRLDPTESLRVIVVDDASADGTDQIVQDCAARLGGIELIRRPAKLGLGTAYVAGFRRAMEHAAHFVLTMDADFSHDPNTIPRLLAALHNQNADVAIGSRYVPGGRTTHWGLHRKILSHTANWLAHRLLGLRARDCTSGFRCYRMTFLQSLDLDAIKTDGYSFLVEILFLCQSRGAAIVEIPIVFRNRNQGVSKISKTEIFKAVSTLWRLSRRRL